MLYIIAGAFLIIYLLRKTYDYFSHRSYRRYMMKRVQEWKSVPYKPRKDMFQ